MKNQAPSDDQSANAGIEEGKRECPFKSFWQKKNKDSNATANAQSSGCPLKRKQQQQVAYDVYSQPIDPTNHMPAVANQLPAPTQTIELSTERVQSNIPKGGTEGETWTYPSPQMFYNALARKGKLTQSAESAEDEQIMMETVVALHNNMNETTWSKVLEWEELLSSSKEHNNKTHEQNEEGSGPKLLRFCGRPSDLSPKARLKNWIFGHPLPFDRHDWTVVRPNGEEARYVIDYYHDEAGDSDIPALNDRGVVKNILVDVRPALDAPTSLYHRAVLMPLARRGLSPNGKTSDFEPLPIMPSEELKKQIQESERVWEDIQKRGAEMLKGGTTRQMMEASARPKISDVEAHALAKSFAEALKECQDAQKAVNELCSASNTDGEDDPKCAKASLQLTMCMAKILCPVQHKAVAQSVHAENLSEEEYGMRVDSALKNVALCLGQVHETVAWAKEDHPKAFEKEPGSKKQ